MPKPPQIRNASQRNSHMNFLLYGIPGIGKTRLLGTGAKTLVLDCGNDETDSCSAAGQSVDVWEVRALTALEEAYEYCRHEGYNDYNWVWIDGLSPLEGRLMKELLLDTVAKNPHRSLYIPDKPEYLRIQSILDRFVQLFVDLPMNVGFTAHVGMEETSSFDDDGDITSQMMMMPMIQGGHGKLSQKICSYMNIVGYMDTIENSQKEQVRAMLVRADGRHIAKDRFNILGNSQGWMVNPTIPKIEAAVKAQLAKAPKATNVTKGVKKATKVAKKATKTTAKKATGLRTK